MSTASCITVWYSYTCHIHSILANQCQSPLLYLPINVNLRSPQFYLPLTVKLKSPHYINVKLRSPHLYLLINVKLRSYFYLPINVKLRYHLYLPINVKLRSLRQTLSLVASQCQAEISSSNLIFSCQSMSS